MDEKLQMIRRRFAWTGLGSSALLVGFDAFCRVSYWHMGVTSTPAWAIVVWLLLLAVTSISAIISIFRWQSFVVLLCLCWVAFNAMQGHWPGW